MGLLPDDGGRPGRRAVVVALAVLPLLGVLLVVTGQPTTRAGRVVPIVADGGSGDAPSAGSGGGAPATATTKPSGPPPPAVTLAFGGDVHAEGVVGTALRKDPASVLAGVRPALSAADVAMVNLETAVTSRGTAADKQYAFRAPTSVFAALKAGGVDLATMANNHGMDYGPAGLDDSLAAAKAAGFPVVGIGHDAAEAFAPHVVTVKGQRVALLGATQVLDTNLAAAWTAGDGKPGLASAQDPARLVAAVRAARAANDIVVVYLHWGTEQATCPNDQQPVLAQQLLAAGADAVVGSHAHRLEGAGRLGDGFVAYGLGNLAFYATDAGGTTSGVLTLTMVGRHVDQARWTPAKIVGGRPRALTGPAATKAFEGLRACAGLTA